MGDRIVVDTSVLISALISNEGSNRKVLRFCLNGQYIPLISNALFREIEDVNARAEIVELCPLSSVEKRQLLDAFYSVCHWIPIYYLWRPNLKDESDNFLIELAIAGNARCIVTNNIKDLTGAELSFENLQIVTPEMFVRDN